MAGSIVVGLPDIFNRFDLETKDLILECPRIIRNKVAVKLIDWKVFGAFLGFPPEKLASIDVECHSEDERKIALLDCWHEREGEDATCLRLAEVLYDRNRRDLVCYLCELTKTHQRASVSESETTDSAISIPRLEQRPSLDSMLDETADITEKIDDLEQQFATLHRELLSDLKANAGISVDDFLQALTLLPLSLRREYEKSIQDKLSTLERIPTISGMFLRLNPLFSFIDYDLLEHLIRKFGSQNLQQGATSYATNIEVFMRQTTVAQLMDCWPGLEELPANFSQIRVKFNNNPAQYTLKRLNKFRKKFCSHIRLSHFILLLIRVEPGSFYAIWHIPSVLIPDLMKSANQIGDGFYHYEHVLSLSIDGVLIYSLNSSEAKSVSSKQVVLFPLDQEYLTCKTDGYYFEGRDYRVKGQLDSNLFAHDLTTRAQFIIKISDNGSSNRSTLLHECHVLSRLGRHNNVIRFLGGVLEELESSASCGPVHTCRMMFEYTEDGSLEDMLVDEDGASYPLSIDQSLYYLHQVLSGVQFLHQNNVIHLNICAENVLLFDCGRIVKLSEFGRATSADTNAMTKLSDNVLLSTFFCSAPEVVREQVPTPAADLWSIMCTMVQMITGKWTGCVGAPQLAVTMLVLVGSYSDDLLHKLIPLDKLDLDFEIAQLFIDVFKKDPALRPTAGDLLKRPVVNLAQEYEQYI